jgi:hypothetical protein
MGGKVLISAHETLLAKFRLFEPLSLDDKRYRRRRFWKVATVGVGFNRSGRDAMADGLELLVSEINNQDSSSHFLVPWGSDHGMRLRSNH